MLSLFTYYSDFMLEVRKMPGNIVIKDCTVENCDRFLHFDFTGTHVWQTNKPLTGISFENIKACGISMPFNAYGDSENPLTLILKNCDITFSEACDCAIRGGNFALVEAENVVFQGVRGALVKCYGETGEIKAEGVVGADRLCDVTDEPFYSKSI